MLKKKVKKYLLISGISFAIGTLGIIFVSVLIEEVVRAIAGEEANKQITQSDLEGLPAWITVEMVQAAIDMMNETGYPASVVLGQMILEAGADGSELANPPYYNCLGQKAHCYKKRNSRDADRRGMGHSHSGIFYICKLCRLYACLGK